MPQTRAFRKAFLNNRKNLLDSIAEGGMWENHMPIVRVLGMIEVCERVADIEYEDVVGLLDDE